MKRVKSLKSKVSMQNKNHLYLLSGQVCLKINVCGHFNYICASVKVRPRPYGVLQKRTPQENR